MYDPIQLTIEICLACFILFSIVITSLSISEEKERNTYLLILLAGGFVILSSSAISWAMIPFTGIFSLAVLRLCLFLIFASVPVIICSAYKYLSSLFRYNGLAPHKHWAYCIGFIGIIHLVMLICSLPSGWIYYLDESRNMHMGDGYIFLNIIGLAESLYLYVFMYRHMRVLNLLERIFLLLFILLPLIASIVQIFISDSSILEITFGTCILFFFLFHEAEKTKRLSTQKELLLAQMTELTEKEQALTLREEALASHKQKLSDKEKALDFAKAVNDYYQAQLLEKEQELSRANVQLSASQMRPHFIFNALGSIEQLCKTNPKRAAEATHQFAAYLRTNLIAMSNCDLIEFTDELSHIKAYIWLEEMRFGEDLCYEEDIQAEDFKVPLLSVQPLVENAIKHGMMGMEEGTLHVKLCTWEDQSNVYVRVSDDGCGFDPNALPTDNRTHVGLANVRSHIEHMCRGKLIVESAIGKGAQFTLVLPKQGSISE